MQHSIILKAALGLVVFLLTVALAFAWATNQRERAFVAMQSAEAAQTQLQAQPAAVVGDAAPDSAAEQAPDPAVAAAAFKKRCAKCHEPDEILGWVAAQGGGDQRDALFAFLQDHRKAPQPDSRLIADHFGRPARSP